MGEIRKKEKWSCRSIKNRKKYIYTKEGGKEKKIAINRYTEEMSVGEVYIATAYLKILNDGQSTTVFTCCRNRVEHNHPKAENNYFTFQDFLRSQYCKECGTKIINVIDKKQVVNLKICRLKEEAYWFIKRRTKQSCLTELLLKIQ